MVLLLDVVVVALRVNFALCPLVGLYGLLIEVSRPLLEYEKWGEQVVVS